MQQVSLHIDHAKDRIANKEEEAGAPELKVKAARISKRQVAGDGIAA